MINALHIPVSQNISFKTNTGFSRFGFCKRVKKEDNYVVAINKWFLDEKDLKETIMHELIHTVDGCYNHGKNFHKYADMIKSAYGLNVTVIGNYKLDERAYKNRNSKRKVFETNEFDPNKMILMYCPSCLREFAIKKDTVKFGSRWVCKKCRVKLLFK